MGRYVVDIDKYATLARQTAAEGCVLVKNENQTLPLRKGDKVAVFGRMAFHYYKKRSWLRWAGKHQICGGHSGCIEKGKRYFAG